MSLNVLVLGVNGFIGSALLEHILQKKDWKITGLDLEVDKITPQLSHPAFQFKQGDMRQEMPWIEAQIKKADIILPLVAIANPSIYVKAPLRVFELDFEANLPIVRLCVKYHKRLIFPSTSEVYGMCEDELFDEEMSSLVVGPINKVRWIYSASKQLMDRLIFSYGQQENLSYTLFRPFNWLGPKLDNIRETGPGSARVITQFVGDILRNQEIKLVDGGYQRRCFIDIDDGIDALLRIMENVKGEASQRIFNIGNPDNEISIRGLAELLITQMKTYPTYGSLAEKTRLVEVPSENYYGQGYQDVRRRLPSIKRAEKYLGWKPHTDLKTSLKKILDYHLLTH